MATTDELLGQLASQLIDFHERVRESVALVPDEQMHVLAEACRRKAGPLRAGDDVVDHVWSDMADVIDAELGMRFLDRAATKFFAENPGTVSYCVSCGGHCTPEHIAELREDDFGDVPN